MTVETATAQAGSYLTTEQLAARLGVSVKTVRNKCAPRAVNPWPCARIGDGPRPMLRFSPEHVAEINERIDSRPGLAPTVTTQQLRRAARRITKTA